MKWLKTLFTTDPDKEDEVILAIQEKFKCFHALLEANYQALKHISDLEEKSQGDYLFDMNYIADSLNQIRNGVGKIIHNMIELGGEPYLPLKEKFHHIDLQIEKFLPGKRLIEEDEYTIPLSQLNRERSFSVGSKNAQMGEMKSKIGLPVPEGFAVTAWAYKRFIDANNLQEQISEKLKSVNIKEYNDLVKVSDDIRRLVDSSPVPDDLAQAIRHSYDQLLKLVPHGKVALRSSAIGEDTQFSFAGQYASFLNVQGDEVVPQYRQVIASKFTPKAIYYFLSHELSESELAMSVGCVSMVDAAASGVVYSRDPVNPQNECILVNAIFGLGKYLVDGTLSPDVFMVSRDNGEIVESHISNKPIRLVMNEEGGTIRENVPPDKMNKPAVPEKILKRLAEYAVKLEEHYSTPQDIEWAVDRNGKLFFLQTRPLRVIEAKTSDVKLDVSNYKILIDKGATVVCPGAGGGPVFQAKSPADLPQVPQGAVLVANNPFPGIITVMDKISALVTAVGGVASHMATIAREYRIPTIAGVKGAEKLVDGTEVTVDATEGAVYQGIINELIEARKPEFELFQDTDMFTLLENILQHISPLNLKHPAEPNFIIENCQTFHDITRFCHQRSMEEMFAGAKSLAGKEKMTCKLKSSIPLQVNIIYLDQPPSALKGKRIISEDQIASQPMQAFWGGILQQGWPKVLPSTNLKGFMTVMATNMTTGARMEFSENSYAILSKEYMIVSLRMGYHFTTVEAMCSDEPSKNYIRMQFKAGGASVDRRVRRIKLIMDILSAMGYEHHTTGDFLDTMLTYEDKERIKHKLHQLGRIAMLTKQLDMALANDSITQWYTKDFLKKLGLNKNTENTDE